MKISKVTIFYSWQSDLSKDTNQNGIRLSIKSAIPMVEEFFDEIHLQHDEATRNVSGSPDITKEIFRKITSSDIFICDLTPIGESIDKKKKLPNPNVLIELGYAVAELGWERIILLFNTNFGKIPDDLPFDVSKHRVTPFSITEKSDKTGKKELSNVLNLAIKLIIQNSPLKPNERKNTNPEEEKRKLDVENLKKIMNTIHIQTFDYFLEESPDYLIGNIFHYFESFKSVIKSNSFHLYSNDILKSLNKIFTQWEILLSFGQHYTNNSHTNIYKFSYSLNKEQYEQAEKDLKILLKNKILLSKSFKQLLKIIREQYMEIDLKETSKIAFEDYQRYQLE